MATWTSQRSGLWSSDAVMVGVSPWQGGSNPATGIPANGDTVTIAVGHTVTFDVDQSGFAAGVTVTINGTLEASTSTGSYILKMAANITGTGTLRAGTSSTPYPDDCTFEIQRGGFQITATSLTVDLNCSEPVIKFAKLTVQKAIGQTVLSIDTDLTSYISHWKSGALVRICDVNNGNDNQEHTISSLTSTTLTITSALTAQKEVGAYIVLISRNVKITHTAATGTAISGGSGGRIFAEVRNAATSITTYSLGDIGGTISSFTNALISANGNNISAQITGGINGLFSNFAPTILLDGLIIGTNNGLNSCSGGVVLGKVIGCSNAFNTCAGVLVYGEVAGNAIGLTGGGGIELANAALENAIDLNNISNIYANDTVFAVVGGYNSATSSIVNIIESTNHNQVANSYRAWCRGGRVEDDVSTVYTGRPRSYKHICESASFYVFRNYSVTVEAGGGLVMQCYVRKSASMSYLPRLWALFPGVEPFISGSPSYEAIMTNSVDTWETLVLVYANNTSGPVTLTVRTLAKNASGNVFFDPIIAVLAPTTYDVYNTLLGYVDDLESRLTAGRAAALDYLDVAVSSRLATAGYTAPLDAAGVRSAVGLAANNLDTQLTTIDDLVDDLETRITAIRAGYLDQLENLVADLTIINNGVKNGSILVPHSQDLT